MEQFIEESPPSLPPASGRPSATFALRLGSRRDEQERSQLAPVIAFATPPVARVVPLPSHSPTSMVVSLMRYEEPGHVTPRCAAELVSVSDDINPAARSPPRPPPTPLQPPPPPLARQLQGTLARARAFLKHTASPPSPPSDSPHRWSGHLHRVARILLPFTLDPQDVIPALLRGCSEHEASIDCGLTLTSHAWSVCGGAPPPPAPAERDVTVPVGPRGWTTMTSCAGDPARHWTLVYAATPRPAPPGAVCVCVCAQYSVSQWSFEGGWEVGTQEGWCTGWVRHWERTCARLGGELLSVSQLPPLQLP